MSSGLNFPHFFETHCTLHGLASGECCCSLFLCAVSGLVNIFGAMCTQLKSERKISFHAALHIPRNIICHRHKAKKAAGGFYHNYSLSQQLMIFFEQEMHLGKRNFFSCSIPMTNEARSPVIIRLTQLFYLSHSLQKTFSPFELKHMSMRTCASVK